VATESERINKQDFEATDSAYRTQCRATCD